MRSTCTTCGYAYEMRHAGDFRECRCVEPSDPHVEPVERPRLRGQNGKILARLQRGPATNDELSHIARKYTSRISDLRDAGYNVVCFDEDKRTGVTWYRLEA